MRTYLSDCDIGYVRLLYNIRFLQYALIENIEQKRMDTLPSTSLCDEQIDFIQGLLEKPCNKEKYGNETFDLEHLTKRNTSIIITHLKNQEGKYL